VKGIGLTSQPGPKFWLLVLGLAVVAMAAAWLAADRPPDLWLEVELQGPVAEGSVSMNAAGRDEDRATLGALRVIDERSMTAKLPFATSRPDPVVIIRAGGLRVVEFRLPLAREEDWSVWTEGAGGYAYRYRVRKLEP